MFNLRFTKFVKAKNTSDKIDTLKAELRELESVGKGFKACRTFTSSGSHYRMWKVDDRKMAKVYINHLKQEIKVEEEKLRKQVNDI